MTVEADPARQEVFSYKPLHTLIEAVAAAQDLKGIYEAALVALRDGIGVNKSSILLFDDDGVMRFKAWLGLSAEYRAAVEGHTPWTPDTKNPEPVLVEDVRDDEDLAPFLDVILREGIVALGFVPLVAGGKLLGKFMLYHPDSHVFSEDELQFARMAASQVAFAIDQHIARRTVEATSLQYRQLVEGLAQAVYTTDAAGRVQLYNEAAAELWGRRPERGVDLWCGSWRIYRPDGSPLPLEECPMAVALRDNRPVHGEEIWVERPDGTRVWVQPFPTPLRDADGRLVGAVNVLVDITERKDHERELDRQREEASAQREHLAAVFNSSVAGFTEMDMDGHFLVVNDRFCEMTGRSREELLAGMSCYDVTHPGDVEKTRQSLEALRDGGESFVSEKRYVRPDCTEVWVSKSVSSVHSDTPLKTAVAVVTDITERKVAEAAQVELLRQVQEKSSILRTVEETASILASELDLAKAVQAVTDSATRLTEAEFGAFFYNVFDANGESYMLYTLSGAPTSAFQDLDMPRATDLFGPTFRGQPPIRLRNVKDDPRYGQWAPHDGMPEGHLPVCSYLAVPVRVPSGEVVGGLFFGHSSPDVFTDSHEELAVGLSHWAGIAIDNARHMEATTATAERVKESEARYREIFEASPVSLWEEDFSGVVERLGQLRAQGVSDFGAYLRENPDELDRLIRLVRILDVNRETLRLFEAKSKKSLIASLGTVFLQETREAFIAEMEAIVAGAPSLNSETSLSTLTGKVLDFDFTVAFPSGDSSYNRVLVSLVDITERKRAEAELRAAGALKDQFLGLVSHELRTPVSTIVANALILTRRRSELAEADLSQALEDIAGESTKLKRVIENLLLLTKIEVSGEPSSGPVYLEKVVSDQVSLFHRHHAGRTVEVDPLQDLPPVRAQDALLSMVLENLLTNANKYSPPGTPIGISARTFADKVELIVRDEGIGIKESELENLFTPFYRTSHARGYASGMGLGLAVCKRIVEAYKGTIVARPRPEGGSDFVLVLPLY